MVFITECISLHLLRRFFSASLPPASFSDRGLRMVVCCMGGLGNSNLHCWWRELFFLQVCVWLCHWHFLSGKSLPAASCNSCRLQVRCLSMKSTTSWLTGSSGS